MRAPEFTLAVRAAVTDAVVVRLAFVRASSLTAKKM